MIVVLPVGKEQTATYSVQLKITEEADTLHALINQVTLVLQLPFILLPTDIDLRSPCALSSKAKPARRKSSATRLLRKSRDSSKLRKSRRLRLPPSSHPSFVTTA